MMKGLFLRNLDIVFLIYGLSFFILGITIFLKTRKKSYFELSKILWLIGTFAILHGINEWIEMILLSRKYISYIWTIVQSSILTASFFFLFEFGRCLVKLTHPKFINIAGSILLLCISILLSFKFKFSPSIWPRYLLGFTGCILSAYGLNAYYRNNLIIFKLLKYKKYILITTITLIIYGILAGLISSKAYFFPANIINMDSFLNLTNIPVQIFRTLCACIMTVTIYKMLNIFEWEITCELKSRLQETTTAKAYIDNILKSMIDSLIVITNNKKITSVNKAFCEISGYNKEELMEKPLEELIVEKPLISQKESEQLSQKEFIQFLNKTILTKNNREIPFLFTLSLLKNGSGEITGILLLGKDISEIKKTEQKLIQAQKLSALGKISSIICHDVKNQLALLSNTLYTLKLKITDKDEIVKNKLLTMEKAVIGTDQIINNLWEFSKTNTPQLKEADIQELLTACLEKINLPKNIKIDLKIPKEPLLLNVDKTQITRVFFNIIDNAIQAMAKGGILVIEVLKTNGLIEFIFKDTGIGIKDENKEKIFELFFSTKEKGMGIGLASAKIIVEAHGGSIDIQSQYQKGTTVTIRLPYRKDQNE